MIPRSLLTILVYALPVLVVAFGVLMGGFGLAQGVGEPVGGAVLWWIAMGSVRLLGVDLILLVGALGVNSLDRSDGSSDDRRLDQ